MARTGWWFVALFVALPAVLVAVDLLLLVGRGVWVVPWLALVSMIWAAIGFTVGLGFLPDAELEAR